MSEVNNGLDFALMPEVLEPSFTVTVYLTHEDIVRDEGVVIEDVRHSSIDDDVQTIWMFCGDAPETMVVFTDYKAIRMQPDCITDLDLQDL